MDRDHARFIAECMKKIGTNDNILIKGDVFRFVKRCHQQFDLIFADPPYALETVCRNCPISSSTVDCLRRVVSLSLSMVRPTISLPILALLSTVVMAASTSHCFSDCCRGTLFIVTLP